MAHFFVGLPHLREQPQVCLHTVLLLRLLNVLSALTTCNAFSSVQVRFESERNPKQLGLI